MLYFHVDPTMGHRSGFQVTYTTIKSISEWFPIMVKGQTVLFATSATQESKINIY